MTLCKVLIDIDRYQACQWLVSKYPQMEELDGHCQDNVLVLQGSPYAILGA